MQNCPLLDIKESIYSHVFSQLRLVMPGKREVAALAAVTIIAQMKLKHCSMKT